MSWSDREAANMHRGTETLTATVVYANPEGTGFKFKGHRDFINTPRHDFDGQRLPQAGEVWKAAFDIVERRDGRLAYFARDLEYLSRDEQYQPLLIVPDRPAFEDAEWFWTINDERGAIRRETYDQYIGSSAWQSRRSLVFARSDRLCEGRLPGCTEQATQVHHLSYRFLGCEPLWDLRAVCENCHALLTSMTRRQPVERAQAA